MGKSVKKSDKATKRADRRTAALLHRLTLSDKPKDWNTINTAIDILQESDSEDSSGDDINNSKEAARCLHLDPLLPARYGMRHGGASDDLISKRRDVKSVMRRGRWRSESSLRLYGKETRILDELNKLPRPILDFGVQVSTHLTPLLSNQVGLVAIAPSLSTRAPVPAAGLAYPCSDHDIVKFLRREFGRRQHRWCQQKHPFARLWLP